MTPLTSMFQSHNTMSMDDLSTKADIMADMILYYSMLVAILPCYNQYQVP